MTIVEQTIDSHHLILLFRLRGCAAMTSQNRHARRWNVDNRVEVIPSGALRHYAQFREGSDLMNCA
jgi:hypothetical protein